MGSVQGPRLFTLGVSNCVGVAIQNNTTTLCVLEKDVNLTSQKVN